MIEKEAICLYEVKIGFVSGRSVLHVALCCMLHCAAVLFICLSTCTRSRLALCRLELLEINFATRLTIHNDYRADFGECFLATINSTKFSTLDSYCKGEYF